MDGDQRPEGSCRRGLGWQAKDNASNDCDYPAAWYKSVGNAAFISLGSWVDLGGGGIGRVVYVVVFNGS